MEGLEGTPLSGFPLEEDSVPHTFPPQWLPEQQAQSVTPDGQIEAGRKKGSKVPSVRDGRGPGSAQAQASSRTLWGLLRADQAFTLQNVTQRPRGPRTSPDSLATSAPCHGDVTGKRAKRPLFAHLYSPREPKTSL